jgi:ATP/maltotriose-dependent transcriptional regulator MalT
MAEELMEKNMTGLAESLAYELEQAAIPLLIALDDLHLVYDAEWVAPFFSRFSPLLPAEAHLIIIGRIQPPAPLWRMRSKQTLSIIDESALDFTLDETAMLLESYGLDQSAASEVFRESRGRASRVSAIIRRMFIDSGVSKVQSAPYSFC